MSVQADIEVLCLCFQESGHVLFSCGKIGLWWGGSGVRGTTWELSLHISFGVNLGNAFSYSFKMSARVEWSRVWKVGFLWYANHMWRTLMCSLVVETYLYWVNKVYAGFRFEFNLSNFNEIFQRFLMICDGWILS